MAPAHAHAHTWGIFHIRGRAHAHRGVFRTSRWSVIHHLHLQFSAAVFFPRVARARACAHVASFMVAGSFPLLFGAHTRTRSRGVVERHPVRL